MHRPGTPGCPPVPCRATVPWRLPEATRRVGTEGREREGRSIFGFESVLAHAVEARLVVETPDCENTRLPTPARGWTLPSPAVTRLALQDTTRHAWQLGHHSPMIRLLNLLPPSAQHGRANDRLPLPGTPVSHVATWMREEQYTSRVQGGPPSSKARRT